MNPRFFIALKVLDACPWRKDISLFVGTGKKVPKRGREHGIDDLLKIVIQFCLSFFTVCAYSVLNMTLSTLIRSISRFILSRSGSSASAFLYSSAKVKACSLEF